MRDRQRNVNFQSNSGLAGVPSPTETVTSTPSFGSRTRSTVDDLMTQFSDSSTGPISPVRRTISVPAGTFYRVDRTAQGEVTGGSTIVTLEPNNNMTTRSEGASQGNSTQFFTAESATFIVDETQEESPAPPKRGALASAIKKGTARKSDNSEHKS